MQSSRSTQLKTLRRITAAFMIALFLSGVTAIPVVPELNLLLSMLETEDPGNLTRWIMDVRDALVQTDKSYPFLAYGFDWLAFGHIVIAISFVGAWRDPVRNIWLYQFGMIACILVIPYALLFGALREIPFYWRLIDCGFGIFGFLPLWHCHKLATQLEDETLNEST